MRICVVSGLGRVWSDYHPSVLDHDGPTTVGGGEAALLRTSFGLAARGHQVTAFVPLSGKPCTYRSARFQHLRDAYPALTSGEFDAVISWSDPTAIRIAPEATRRVYAQQLNDMPPDGAFWEAVDTIVPASATHGRFLQQWQPAGCDVAWVPLYGGVVPELYKDAVPFASRKPVVSWWSSPDRGLHHLLIMWPWIRKAVPKAELRIAYHMQRFIEDARELYSFGEAPWRARLLDAALQAARKVGGVKVLGPISRRALSQHQGETKVWAMPFDGIVPTEGLQVSCAEAIAAGCYCISRPDDALREVYDGCVEWVESPLCDDAWRQRFARAVVQALLQMVNPHAQAQAQFAAAFTWEVAALQLERACQLASTRLTSPSGIYQGM